MSAEFLLVAAFNGLLLGLASTLHCAGMCGAIACGLLLAHERGSSHGPIATFAMTNLGRVGAYATAGAIVGLLGAPAIAWLDREAAFRLLQWAGAAAIIGVGLSTAGLLPACDILTRGMAHVSDRLARIRGGLAPLFSGMAWGMLPCAMVYAALFAALLTGSVTGGAVTMLAFGIGTLPGLVATTFGVRRLAGVTGTMTGRLAAGFAIVVFGVATLLLAHPISAYLCAPGTGAAASAASPAAAEWPGSITLDRRQMPRGSGA